MKACASLAGLLVALSLPVIAAAAAVQETPAVLVLNLKNVDQASPVVAGVLGDQVVRDLQERRSYRVISQSDASRTLSAEQLKQLAACASPACVSPVAAPTGAVWAIDGSVGMVGSSYALLLTLIDLPRGVALSQKSAILPGDRDQMVSSVKNLITELLGPIAPQPAAAPPAPVPETTPPPAAYVPLDYSKLQSAPQPAQGNVPLPAPTYAAAAADAVVTKPAPPPPSMNNYRLWGHVAFWSGLAIAGFGGVSTFMAKQAADDYQAGNNAADAEARNRTWGSLAVTGFAVGGLAMATGAVLWILDPGSAGRGQ